MFSKFTSVPNVNRKGSAQENQFQNSAHTGLVRTRSTTLPTSWGEDNQLTTESWAPGIHTFFFILLRDLYWLFLQFVQSKFEIFDFWNLPLYLSAAFSGRYRSQTTLEFAPQIEDVAYEPGIWMPQKIRANSHCERIRKISNIRGTSPRYSRVSSGTVLSTISWQEVEKNEVSRRKRAESLMSTITSDSGDVDFLCSSQPQDNLAEMMTSKETPQSGSVRVVRNTNFFY